MSVITKVSPLIAERGDTLTITGTGFGESQGYNTVEVGGVALTGVTWGDTSITGVIAAATAYGAKDVVVTIDGTPDVVLTRTKGVMVIDATDYSDADEMNFAQVAKIYMDGVHVGYTTGTVKYSEEVEEIEAKANENLEAVDTKSFITKRTFSFAAAQWKGELLATLLNGTWDSTTNKLLLLQNTAWGEHSFAIEEASGKMWLFKRCKPAGGTIDIEINKDFNGIPVTWRALGMPGASGNPVEVYLPAV